MNDWFLRAFRKTPPRDFRQQLYMRLQAEERRLALWWRSAAAFVLLLLALSPTLIRTWNQSAAVVSKTLQRSSESAIYTTVPEWEQELPTTWVYYPPRDPEALGPLDYRTAQKRQQSPAEKTTFIAMVIPGERR